MSKRYKNKKKKKRLIKRFERLNTIKLELFGPFEIFEFKFELTFFSDFEPFECLEVRGVWRLEEFENPSLAFMADIHS